MKLLMCIAAFAALLVGCRATAPSAADGGARRNAARPDWFQVTFRSGSPASDKFAAFWDGVFSSGAEITEKSFEDARKILDAALVGEADGEDMLAIQHNCIANDCMMMLFRSHAAMAAIHDGAAEIMAQALDGRRFAAICKANEARFQDWLPKFREWDRKNGDWSGAQWAALFDGRVPMHPLPEVWMGRRSEQNLAAETLEKWRGEETFPVRFWKDCAGHFKQDRKPLWLLQAIEKTEVPEGARIYMNLHAFPGRCKVFVNSAEAVSFDDGLPRSFAVPLDFGGDGKCVVVFCIFGEQNDWNDTVQHAPWPVWLAHDRP